MRAKLYTPPSRVVIPSMRCSGLYLSALLRVVVPFRSEFGTLFEGRRRTVRGRVAPDPLLEKRRLIV